MAELIKTLSEAFGVSGNEKTVRSLILENIKDKCDDITVDTMGNIIAFKKGKSSEKTIAVTANMDEVGFIISEITDKGYLKFKLVGDTDPRKLVSKKVIIGGEVKGVIGMKAIHLQTADERKNVVKAKDLFIDIGAEDKEAAARKVKLGTYGTFYTQFEKIGDTIKGKALERSGVCSALIKALDGDYPYSFYACFLCQTEVGARGAKIVTHRVNPDVILTVSAADTTDMYGCKNNGGMSLGGGVTVCYGDRSGISDKHLTDALLKRAKENSIKLQTKALLHNKSDSGALQQGADGAKLLEAVIPCRYAHSPVSIMSLGDIDETEKYIKLFLSCIGEMI